jgi:hypothetical protein
MYNNKTSNFWIHKIHDMNEVVSLHTEQSSPHHLMKDRDWWSWQCDTLQICAITQEWGKLIYQPQDFNVIQQNQLWKADMMVSKWLIMVGSYCYSRRKEIRHWNTKLWFSCCRKLAEQMYRLCFSATGCSYCLTELTSSFLQRSWLCC